MKINLNNKTFMGLGAAFLMANSSIGPGFLTQTAFFTENLIYNFGFIILVAILLDLIAQLNIWQVIVISNKRLQEVGNAVYPNLGLFITILVLFGGICFSLGNIAGAGLAMNVLLGIDFKTGAFISCLIAITLFFYKKIGFMLGTTAIILGCLKICLASFIMIKASPNYSDALVKTFIPTTIDFKAIITIVGGTVGGYICFAGAHKFLDEGVYGPKNIKIINQNAVRGILFSSIMRYILFLAIVGVVSQGIVLDKNNPAATVFKAAAGDLGYFLFGIILFSASLSAIIGASYTSISFIKTFHPSFIKFEKFLIISFIILSCSIFLIFGKPKELLIFAGQVNGFILPIAIIVVLLSVTNTKIMQNYKFPKWLFISGWVAAFVLIVMSIYSIIE